MDGEPWPEQYSVVVLERFLVCPVKNCFRPGGFCNTDLKIVRNRQTGHTAKVVVGMDMAKKPVPQLHVVTNLGIGIADARENRSRGFL